MNILTLRAYADSFSAWSFVVKDVESGLILPIKRDSWEIFNDNETLALKCQIILNGNHPECLSLKMGEFCIVCEQGMIRSLAPIEIKGGVAAECVVPLDGFGADEGV